MKLSWKLFKRSYPLVCTKCGKIANMKREYCESCGEKDSFRKISKKEYDLYQED